MEIIYLWSNPCHPGKWNHPKLHHSQVWWLMLSVTNADTIPEAVGQNTSSNLSVEPGLPYNVVAGSEGKRKPSKTSTTFYDLLSRYHSVSFLSHSIHCSVYKDPPIFNGRKIDSSWWEVGRIWDHTQAWKHFCGHLYLENAMCHMGYYMNSYINIIRSCHLGHGRKEIQMQKWWN